MLHERVLLLNNADKFVSELIICWSSDIDGFSNLKTYMWRLSESRFRIWKWNQIADGPEQCEIGLRSDWEAATGPGEEVFQLLFTF